MADETDDNFDDGLDDLGDLDPLEAPEVPAVEPEAVAAVAVDEELDPEKHVAVDLGANGVYTIYDSVERPFARTVNMNGKTYEHVGEHRGVWAYRHLG